MKLPRTEDTAILLVSELAENYGHGLMPLSVVAERHGLSFLFLKKLARQLKQAGLITSQEGSKGGYELAKPPHQINAWEIMDAVSHNSNDNPEINGNGVCPLNDHCLPQTIKQSIENTLKISLSKITLAGLKE
jgi:Rrf2 family transcriptional regulator, cysteine metabolism repressor